ncbi:glycoside hydrolase [Nostoc flagelliforme CCNUN1]|uniref:Glycoside hydrolase n=1 Tax=Nostoc flagelliforme CCNUN1 TaxID=2038116 RepID=A0A2K8T0T5_9NOSO|nr:glycoside hydrolase [Nostoc flagelliforme CCNUN1]
MWGSEKIGGRGSRGGRGSEGQELITIPHAPCPMPHAQCPIPNIYWAQMPTSCVNYLNLSALVFLVQKFHKQGTNNYQLINYVLSINTCRLYG